MVTITVNFPQFDGISSNKQMCSSFREIVFTNLFTTTWLWFWSKKNWEMTFSESNESNGWDI